MELTWYAWALPLPRPRPQLIVTPNVDNVLVLVLVLALDRPQSLAGTTATANGAFYLIPVLLGLSQALSTVSDPARGSIG